MWATRIFNLCTKPLQAMLSHLPFFLHPAGSLNWYHLKVTHAQQGWRPLTLRSCLRVILNLLFSTANERGCSSAPLSRGAVIYYFFFFFPSELDAGCHRWRLSSETLGQWTTKHRRLCGESNEPSFLLAWLGAWPSDSVWDIDKDPLNWTCALNEGIMNVSF